MYLAVLIRASWHGPIHLLISEPTPGDMYRITGWIYYDTGPENHEFWLTITNDFKDPNVDSIFKQRSIHKDTTRNLNKN